MTTDDLRIELVMAGDSAQLSVSGELDLSNVNRLRAVLMGLVQADLASVDVDLSEVMFLDSTALGVLIQGKRRFEESGGTLGVGGMSERVRRTLNVAGVDDFLVAD